MTIANDENNRPVVASLEAVDGTNARFYGRFQYPWAPMAFQSVTDPYFETVMLNQSIGSWDHSVIPREPAIWVAGCGTNQANFTALKFPRASVLGSDLSTTSLETCAATARQLGIENLELKQESLNAVPYDAQFDYVISTGVIHHNADPEVPLTRIARALKPSGILELMVYNRYHRIETTAFQKAIRILCGEAGAQDFESQLDTTRAVMNGYTPENMMTKYLNESRDLPESALADRLLQPVEYSFTVESLEDLADRCGLEFVAPCINQFDKADRTFSWNIEFEDRALQERYDALPDSRRWQVSNLLMLDKSPMLWFYLQRKDSGRPRRTEQQLSEEFLRVPFVRSTVEQQTYVREDSGQYTLIPNKRPHLSGNHPEPICRRILDKLTPRTPTTVGDVFRQLGLDPLFQVVNRARLCLTTNAFPYLVATC